MVSLQNGFTAVATSMVGSFPIVLAQYSSARAVADGIGRSAMLVMEPSRSHQSGETG